MIDSVDSYRYRDLMASSYDRLYPEIERPIVHADLGRLPERLDPMFAYANSGVTRFANLLMRHAVKAAIEEGGLTTEQIQAAWQVGALVARASFVVPGSHRLDSYPVPFIGRDDAQYVGTVTLCDGDLRVKGCESEVPYAEVRFWRVPDGDNEFAPYEATLPLRPDDESGDQPMIALHSPFPYEELARRYARAPGAQPEELMAASDLGMMAEQIKEGLGLGILVPHDCGVTL